MVGLMPTSRTRLDSSFHNIAKQSRLATYVFEWVPLWTAHTFCCVSVCRNHWWTVNELIMSEYFHGMFTSCIDFTITLKRTYPFICRAMLRFEKDAVFCWEIVHHNYCTYWVVKMKSCMNYSTDECGAALWNGASCSLHGPGSLWPVWLQSED